MWDFLVSKLDQINGLQYCFKNSFDSFSHQINQMPLCYNNGFCNTLQDNSVIVFVHKWPMNLCLCSFRGQYGYHGNRQINLLLWRPHFFTCGSLNHRSHGLKECQVYDQQQKVEILTQFLVWHCDIRFPWQPYLFPRQPYLATILDNHTS